MIRAIKIAVVVLVLAVAVLLLLPSFIDLAPYRARYLPLVEEGLQRKVDVGEVRLRILPSPAIRVSRLNISDHPAYGAGPFFNAEQLSLRLKLWPLFRGRLQIDEFVLEKPAAHLVQRPDGSFNFSDLGKKKGEREKKKTPDEKANSKSGASVQISDLIPARVRIEDGEVTLESKGKRPLRAQGIALSLEDFSTDRSFPYRMALGLPALKPVVLQGLASYSESGASLNLKESHLRIQEVDFEVSGGLTRLTEAPQASLTLFNGAFETGPIFELLSQAEVTPEGFESSGPMGLRVSIKGPLEQMISSVNADLQALQVNVPKAFRGTLTGKIQFGLPLGGKVPVSQALEGGGKVTAQNGVLTNVDLLSKIRLITGLIGLPEDQSRGATTFKTLESEFTLANGIAQFQRLFLSSPLLEARGAGKMTLSSPSLNVSIEAALSPEISARAGSGGPATFFQDDQGRIVIPLRVRGPAHKPSVDLDKEKLVRKSVSRFLGKGGGEFLERFFKRK